MNIWVFLNPRASDTISGRIGEDVMKKYTAKEMKLLKVNPYTFKVTKNKLYFTAGFKEAFWTAYQAGMAQGRYLKIWDMILGYLVKNRSTASYSVSNTRHSVEVVLARAKTV